MRTSIINQLTRGIFFLFLFLFLIVMLTACTSREDIVLELNGRGNETENAPETNAESIAEAEGELSAESVPEAEGEWNAESVPEAGAVSETGPMQETVQPDIYVHICGAVEDPGVYILAAGSRVYEGVAAAGGFRNDACEDFINQAGILQDGQRLVIPTVEEAEAAKADGSYQTLWQEEVQNAGTHVSGAAGMADDPSGSVGGLVNINTATESELSAIPGIGAGKAAAIVQYRQENGNFASIEEIMKVSGIKEGTFEKIKDKITVN